MAPLDLDKYVEIARLCKYLPENDLKVRLAGAGALLSGLPPFRQRDSRRPALPLSAGPPAVSCPVTVEGLTRCEATRSDLASRGERGQPESPECHPDSLGGDPKECRGLCARVARPGLGAAPELEPSRLCLQDSSPPTRTPGLGV